jgi:hypothetical protein
LQVVTQESGRSPAISQEIEKAVARVPAWLWAAVTPQIFSLLHDKEVRRPPVQENPE